MDITLKINWAEHRILVMFVNSLQNQIKWFLANTWTETLTDGSAICCCQVKNQENWHWLHCWEGNYSCDKICKPMHYAYMWNGFLFIGFLLANQSLTDARAICCHTTKSIQFPANSERMPLCCLTSGGNMYFSKASLFLAVFRWNTVSGIGWVYPASFPPSIKGNFPGNSK